MTKSRIALVFVGAAVVGAAVGLIYARGPWGTRYSPAQWEAFGSVVLGFGALAVAGVFGWIEHSREESKQWREANRRAVAQEQEAIERAKLITIEGHQIGSSRDWVRYKARVKAEGADVFRDVIVFVEDAGVQDQKLIGIVRGSDNPREAEFPVHKPPADSDARFRIEYTDAQGNRWRQDAQGDVALITEGTWE